MNISRRLGAELFGTFWLVLGGCVIMGATDKRIAAGSAPITIGLVLILIPLISIRVTNISVNSARSTGPALFVRGWRWDSCGCFGLHRWLVARSAAFCTVRSPLRLT